MNIGERFQEDTTYKTGKDITIKKKSGKTIQLPKPDETLLKKRELWRVVEGRRSRRRFSGEAITLDELSILLWATQGITLDRPGVSLRASPSAGALYSNDTYLVVNNVDGLDRGLYFYHPEEHSIEIVEEGDLRYTVVEAGLGQDMLGAGNVSFIWAAVLERATWKYKQRAYRYIYLDAGHICQNLYLTCEALGFGCCGVAAFFDDAANALIGVDGVKETCTYMAAVGKL